MWKLLLLLVFLFSTKSSAEILQKALKEIMNNLVEIGNATVPATDRMHFIPDSNCTMSPKFCIGQDPVRYACCRTDLQVKMIMNVQIKDGKMFAFHPPQGQGKCETKYRQANYPGLEFGSTDSRSSKRRRKVSVEIVNEAWPPSTCKSVFDGTLHVQNRHLPHVLFHMLNDNMLPILAHAILDAYYFPEYAYKPRWFLKAPKDGKAIPHYEDLFLKAMDGIPTLEDLDGICIRRVIWGKAFTMYHNHIFVALRRQTGDLLKRTIELMYPTTVPSYFIARDVSKPVVLSPKTGGLNILIMSRFGQPGRNILPPGEEKLKENLEKLGHHTKICCDFKSMGFGEQFGMWAHTDVIVGIHGAGLTNAAFCRRGVVVIEFKTPYGYTDRAYHTTLDSRVGYHIQLDFRPNLIPSKRSYNMDSDAIARIIYALDRCRKNNPQLGYTIPLWMESKYKEISYSTNNKLLQDLQNGMAVEDGEMGHILGPPMAMRKKLCAKLPFFDPAIWYNTKTNKIEKNLRSCDNKCPMAG